MVQSIHRAFDLLQAIAVEPAGLTELAKRSELPKSTTARLLSTLESIEAIERTDAGTYRLGATLNTLASSSPNTDLASVAVPHLQQLTELTGEASGLSIPDGYLVHYIAQVESDNPIQIRDWTDELIPMHVVPSGLVFMAEWPTERIERYFGRKPKASTKRSLKSAKALAKRLDTLSTTGFVWANEEFVEGLNSVAAPVRNPDGLVVAAIHVHGPAYRFPTDGAEDEIGQAVLKTATRLERSIKRLS